MTTHEDRVTAALPHAAELVCAVTDHDDQAVAAVLHRLDRQQLYALAVVLAAHVPDTAPLGDPRRTLTPERIAHLTLAETARRYGTTIGDICSPSRVREVTEARAVAIAVMRNAGLTSVLIGRLVGRDHSTVLYAATRVGENAKLRRIALAIAHHLALPTGALGDADETHLEVVA